MVMPKVSSQRDDVVPLKRGVALVPEGHSMLCLAAWHLGQYIRVLLQIVLDATFKFELRKHVLGTHRTAHLLPLRVMRGCRDPLGSLVGARLCERSRQTLHLGYALQHVHMRPRPKRSLHPKRRCAAPCAARGAEP